MRGADLRHAGFNLVMLPPAKVMAGANFEGAEFDMSIAPEDKWLEAAMAGKTEAVDKYDYKQMTNSEGRPIPLWLMSATEEEKSKRSQKARQYCEAQAAGRYLTP